MPDALTNPTLILLAVVALLQLGVFDKVHRAGQDKNQLAILSRLVGELSSTVATLSIAVAKGEANDMNHGAHIKDVSDRLQSIEQELRGAARVGGVHS